MNDGLAVMEIEEKVALLREALVFYAAALGWGHVAENERRRSGLLETMRWVSCEIGNIIGTRKEGESREARLDAWVHPDALQHDVWLAMTHPNRVVRRRERNV